MPKARNGEINWSRLIAGGAVVVLVGAIWTSQRHSHASPADAPAITTPSGMMSVSDAKAPGDSQDPAGWSAIGESRFSGGLYNDAVTAYEHEVTLAPGDAAAWSALGEARVMASEHDPMPAEALRDFEKSIALDPKEPRARYFMAVDKDLGGDHQGAVNDWLALLGDTPPGAPWEADLRRTIEQVARIHHLDVATRVAAIHQPAPPPPAEGPGMGAMPGPSAQDLQAASSIPPSQQQAMARSMVAQLESQLAANPHNAEGWAMLIRSKLTLDGPQAGSAALAKAITADPGDAVLLRDQARALGVQ